METVGGIDGESIHDLRNRILLLSEENNILLGHLDELRVMIAQKNLTRRT
jgi:hypothetical protein